MKKATRSPEAMPIIYKHVHYSTRYIMSSQMHSASANQYTSRQFHVSVFSAVGAYKIKRAHERISCSLYI